MRNIGKESIIQPLAAWQFHGMALQHCGMDCVCWFDARKTLVAGRSRREYGKALGLSNGRRLGTPARLGSGRGGEGGRGEEGKRRGGDGGGHRRHIRAPKVQQPAPLHVFSLSLFSPFLSITPTKHNY